MNHKHTMSDEEARTLIAEIKRRARGLPGCTQYDYFHRPAEVCELVEATLIGVGYDSDWVCGPFSQMLEKEVKLHRAAVLAKDRCL